MNQVVVMRQVLSVIDGKLRRVAREAGLSLDDLLVIAWLVDRPGVAATRIAEGLGRDRSNVHRSLQALERRELAEPYRSAIDERVVGWGPTSKGLACFQNVERSLEPIDRALSARAVYAPRVDSVLRDVLSELYRSRPRWGEFGLVDPPAEPEIPEWDL